MRLQVFSDLHVEFEPFEPPTTDADVIVLAGDIHVRHRGLEWAKESFPDRPVLYVFGNHEYYGRAIPRHREKMQALAAETNVRILEQTKLLIEDVVFLGCTLWTDFRLFGDPRIAGYHATERMSDYHKIVVSPGFHRLRSIDTAVMHERSKEWLASEFERHQGQRIVVITHHAPSPRSIPARLADELLNAAYASDLEEFILEHHPALWVHGHIHTGNDYRVGDTRVVCNPRGYPGECEDTFDPGLVVEV